MIRKLVLRVGLFLVVSIGLYIGAVSYFNSRLDANVIVKVNKGTTAVVLGHSHVECAYRDELIEGVENFGSSGEALIYTYTKLRLLIDHNPSVRTVFVEFANNHVTENEEVWMWGDEVLSRHYANLEPFMEKEDHRLLAAHNFAGYTDATFLAAKRVMYNVVMGDYNYSERLGGFLDLKKKNKVDSLLENRKEPPAPPGIAENNMLYLRKIVAYCRKAGVAVYFIRTPVHPLSYGWRNETLYLSTLEERFSDVPFLDLSHYPLANEEYADLDHLNGAGASNYSSWFNHLLRSGLLEQEDPQSVIDAEIDSLSSRPGSIK